VNLNIDKHVVDLSYACILSSCCWIKSSFYDEEFIIPEGRQT